MDLTPWEKVKLARMPIRPTGLDYIDYIFDGFMELHGDRLYGEDLIVEVLLSLMIFLSPIAQQRGAILKKILLETFQCHILKDIGSTFDETGRKFASLLSALLIHQELLWHAEERGQGEAVQLIWQKWLC